jgi:hypothetical protein
MKMIVQEQVTETEGFLTPAAADKRSCSTSCSVESKTHLDHWTENFGTELVMSKRHEANDVIPFTHADV